MDGIATKRSSRSFDDEHNDYSQLASTMSSLSTSRRSSRRSSKEDLSSYVKEREDEKRAEISLRSGSTITLMSSGSSSSTIISSRLDLESGNRPVRHEEALALLSGSPAADRIANFGVIMPGVYRSSYPLLEHFPFCQSLGLKTIVTLVNKDDDRSVNLNNFIRGNGIRHVMFEMKGTKKEDIPHHTMSAILAVLLDKSHYPLLIHCNQGKHRTGCVVAAARRVSGWTLETALDEYKQFAEPKIRDCDVGYITNLDVTLLGQPQRAISGRPSPFRVLKRSKVFFICLWTVLVWAFVAFLATQHSSADELS